MNNFMNVNPIRTLKKSIERQTKRPLNVDYSWTKHDVYNSMVV